VGERRKVDRVKDPKIMRITSNLLCYATYNECRLLYHNIIVKILSGARSELPEQMEDPRCQAKNPRLLLLASI